MLRTGHVVAARSSDSAAEQDCRDRRRPQNPIILIPARLASTRLPGKPLADIAGAPMIVHVWRRAVVAEVAPVVVACGDPEIAEAIEAVGGPRGADRSAACRPAPTASTRRSCASTRSAGTTRSSMSRATCRCSTPPRSASRSPGSPTRKPTSRPWPQSSRTTAALADTSVNKVVAGFADPALPARALYFSKAVVPWGDGPHYEHIGLYAYRRAALERFVALPRGVLEQRERLEQLRALEAGMRISVSLIEPGTPRRPGRHPGRSRTRPPIDAATTIKRWPSQNSNPPIRRGPSRSRAPPAPIPTSLAGASFRIWRPCRATSSRTPLPRCARVGRGWR